MSKAYQYDEAASRKTERAYQSPEIIRQRVATLEILNLQADERVIDVGCGPGLLAHEMALAVEDRGSVVGIDSSEPMLQLARRRCQGLGQIRIEHGDATRIDEDDASFDAAVCVQVLLYVDAVEDAVAEMHRVLRPGGRIVIMETDWAGLVLSNSDEALTRKVVGAWDLDVPSPKLPARLGPLLRRKGFDAIKVHAVPIVSTSYNPNGFSITMMKQFAECARKYGIAKKVETAAWLEDLKRLGEESAYFFCVNRFLFSAVKV